MKFKSLVPNIYLFAVATFFATNCAGPANDNTADDQDREPGDEKELVVILPDTTLGEGEYIDFSVNVEIPGRYKLQLTADDKSEQSSAWIEDYVGNADGRTYNITGNLIFDDPGVDEAEVYGSPLDKGIHKMRLHVNKGMLKIDQLAFSLMKKHRASEKIMEQNTTEGEWKIVWSDEFDDETIDTSKWTFDIGNWGWGNNELQYYTDNRPENARIEDGALVIEARKNDMGEDWTSARLTTRGKIAFLHGKIELRAIVPREKGNWAAGWTLGNSYVDELSWPYCGEIDILESVGYEVDNETGDGIAHATVHTPAYYFKINNQISSTKEVKDIANEWHTYSVEWTPTEIKGFVDGEQYYLYDKNADEKEWPFFDPQNIILNLAMGGGWGGAQGMDTTVVSQKYLVDYVRVYGK